jgi:putative restriction endonuclease
VLLEQHFPECLHEEILDEVGLDLERWVRRDARDPAFRFSVLQAYERSCAVCGFDGHMSSGPFGLDAAHVKWKQAGGPDEVVNGVAMCVLHHRAFDRGAFTIGLDLHVSISADLTGSQGIHAMFFGSAWKADSQASCGATCSAAGVSRMASPRGVSRTGARGVR